MQEELPRCFLVDIVHRNPFIFIHNNSNFCARKTAPGLVALVFVVERKVETKFLLQKRTMESEQHGQGTFRLYKVFRWYEAVVIEYYSMSGYIFQSLSLP